MSGGVVLDASVAVRAVMDAGAQPALLDRIEQATVVLAPTLLRVETANALWKYARAGVLTDVELAPRLDEALALIHRFIDEQPLFPEALQFASEFDHPVYDAVYAITARRHAATLLTFDQRVRKLCARAGIACQGYGTRA